jgi:quercetin dioxygenase-like cupin family protein
MKILTPSALILLIISLFLLNGNETDQNRQTVHSEILLQTTTAWDGSPIEYPEGEAQVTAFHIEVEPGGETGWHHHPVPSIAYILQGSLEVTLENGKTIRVKEGDAIAEVFNTVHNGQNVGDDTVKLVVFYTGVVGGDLTIMQP